MATQTLVLPGETISPDLLPIPSNPSLALKLGPGLRHTPPSTITTVFAGSLCIDQKKNAIWVENNSGRVILPPTSHPHSPCSLPLLLLMLTSHLMTTVHTTAERPNLSHRPPLLHRLVSLHHNAPHAARPTPPPSLRKRHQKNPPPTRPRQPNLRARPLRLQTHRCRGTHLL